MSSSIREQIMLAVMAHLATVDRPADMPAPVRTRLVSPNSDQLPVLTVYQGREVVSPMHTPREGRASRGAIVQRALEVKIEAVVKASGDGSDAAADPLLVWAATAMAGGGTLGGLANDPPDEAETSFSYEQGAFAFIRATMTFLYEYPTLIGDPTIST